MMKTCKADQRGFTMVELLVAIAILGAIGTAIPSVIMGTITHSTSCSSNVTASQQVSNAGYWVKEDGVKAQLVEVNNPDFIELHWVEWNGSEHRVVYTLSDRELIRSHYVDASLQGTYQVAEAIVEANTNSSWDGHTLVLQIAAQDGDQEFATTYRIKPRPLNY